MNRLLHSLAVMAVVALAPHWQASQEVSTLQEATKAGSAAIAAGNWQQAESYFRKAVELAPKQGFWRIQLVLVLGHERKWQTAFAEMEPLIKNGAVDWLITANRNLPAGTIAFIDSDRFSDEREGITRYVQALKEKTDATEIRRDIGVKFDAFADEHKIALIYDISKFKRLPFEKGDTRDVTSDFIAYYNQSAYTRKYFGTVYLYRGIDTVNYGTQIIVLNPEAVVFLDGKEFLRMPEKTFIGFKVPVGRYVLQMAWNGGTSHVVTVEPNGTYYLRVQQIAYPNKFQTISFYAEKTALEQIRMCYVLSKDKVKLDRFDVIRTNPNNEKK